MNYTQWLKYKDVEYRNGGLFFGEHSISELGKQYGTPSFIINESCYNSTGPVLKQIHQVGDVGYCRGYPLITIFLYPVQYYLH